MARMHGGRRPNEKAKDFKGTMKKLIRYMAIYKVQVFFVAVFAICGTIFNIVGPKILGKATTEIFNGLVSKFPVETEWISANRTDSADCSLSVCNQRNLQLCAGIFDDRCVSEDNLSSEKRNLREDQPYADELF